VATSAYVLIVIVVYLLWISRVACVHRRVIVARDCAREAIAERRWIEGFKVCAFLQGEYSVQDMLCQLGCEAMCHNWLSVLG
jgi:hypothetical protein